MGSYDEIPLLLTVRQVHELTGMHEVTIRKGIKDGNIVADKINNTWYISRDALLPNIREAAMAGRGDDHEGA